jgi:hypothetical protein
MRVSAERLAIEAEATGFRPEILGNRIHAESTRLDKGPWA